MAARTAESRANHARTPWLTPGGRPVWNAIVELQAQGLIATRQAIASTSGCTLTTVDDRLREWVDAGYLRRPLPGVFELVEQHPPARPVTVTLVQGGLAKLEIGDLCLDLYPEERRMLASLLVGDALHFSNLQTSQDLHSMFSAIMSKGRESQRTAATSLKGRKASSLRRLGAASDSAPFARGAGGDADPDCDPEPEGDDSWKGWVFKKGERPTAEQIRLVLDYDPTTGILTWRKNTSPLGRAGSPAGHVSAAGSKKSHLVVGLRGKHFLGHHLAWLHKTGEWPAGRIRHRDGNKMNNAFSNLENVAMNPLVGTERRGNRFVARLFFKGKTLHLGMFDTAEEAHAAYLAEKQKLQASANTEPAPH
ncbi:HNH endonuclease [Ottowia testudinis]|uniref:HNH endonuclease n=1 Tax=Ottowia testudinis TaxID=2816950 RepID=A0A975CGA7_9BURK|nr:HNH endonuclease [Ottowia testudinis]QTD44561.1 HNH endonuclease [Ottowia testudinis]